MSAALQAKALLIRAVECDQSGRILEAQTLYQDGIAQLMTFVSTEPDEVKRKGFLTRIKEYMDRADAIKARVNGQLMLGEVVTHLSIEENDTGNDYDQIFGKYMTNQTIEIMLEEPYLSQNYQVSVKAYEQLNLILKPFVAVPKSYTLLGAGCNQLQATEVCAIGHQKGCSKSGTAINKPRPNQGGSGAPRDLLLHKVRRHIARSENIVSSKLLQLT